MVRERTALPDRRSVQNVRDPDRKPRLMALCGSPGHVEYAAGEDDLEANAIIAAGAGVLFPRKQ
jgi:hypothetical protein